MIFRCNFYVTCFHCLLLKKCPYHTWTKQNFVINAPKDYVLNSFFTVGESIQIFYDFFLALIRCYPECVQAVWNQVVYWLNKKKESNVCTKMCELLS
jgi:hypothetical protein